MMMSKKLLAGVAVFATLGMAVPAMAQETTNTITVEETLSLTVDHTAVALTLNRTQGGAINYDTTLSGIKHLNNVKADISVAIKLGAGATALPADLVYWVFRDKTEAAAITAIEANSVHSPTDGIFRYAGSAVNAVGGVPTTVFKTVLANSAYTSVPVVYAADARNSLPPPASHVTVVTWTIAKNTTP